MRDLRSIIELRRNSSATATELTPNESQVFDILTALMKKINRRETDKDWGELKLTVLTRSGQIAEFRFVEESIHLGPDDQRRKKV